MFLKMRLLFHVLAFLVTSAAACSTASVFAQSSLPKLTRGPYLQLATPSSVSILWRTQGETQPIVRFGLTTSELTQTIDTSAIQLRTVAKEAQPSNDQNLHSAPHGTVQYEATLTGLEPDRTYFYALMNGSEVLAAGKDYFFHTHPAPRSVRPVRIWVVGDSGTGDSRQAAVYQAMQDYLQKQNQHLDFYLHVGDMGYPSGTDAEFQRNFFDV